MSLSRLAFLRTIWISRGLALFALSIATVGLLNWITGAHSSFPLNSPLTMKTNASIGLLCLSSAVLLQSFPQYRHAVAAARVFAGLASLIGLATLSQHAFGINLGIDQFLFTEPPGAPATTSPNRMGPPVSLMLWILGGAVCFLPRTPHAGRNVQWLALFTLAISIVPLTGYMFGATDLYDIPQVTGIAPHSALATLLLSVSTLLLRPDRPPVDLLSRQDAGGAMARRLIPVALLLPPAVGILVSKARDTGLVDIPMARVLMQVMIVLPMLGFVWWTARHLSAATEARDQARSAFDRARNEAEGLAAQNVETSNLLDRMLDNAPVGLAILDRSFRYVRINPFLAYINGIDVEKHQGRTLREVIPEQAERFEALVAQVFEEGTAVQGIETVARTAAAPDVDRCFCSELFPVPDRFGKVSLVGMVVMDVTEQKRLDEQKAALLETERNARAEAERVGLMKDEFLATLSHELRTPLTSIVGWSQILQMKQHDPADLQRGLETIDRNSKALSQLINDLLDVSRIINGKLHLNMLPIPIQAVVGAALDSVTPSLQAKRIDLVRDFDPEPLYVYGDPSRLQQVIWNLLTNAVKFTPGAGRIRVVVRKSAQEAEIEISDTGVGIKPEFLQHLFQRFRQGDASTTRRFGGLGLGLSIVRQLVELHAGRVRVMSEGVNRGSTFVVTLPLSSGVQPSALERRSVQASPLTSFNGLRVLIVEDEVDTRAMLTRILEDAGIVVLSAASVDEGMVCIESDRPQLVISDIGMPGKDGYELVRQLRDRRSACELPAIALSAFARAEDSERSVQAGFQLHLSKPTSPRELLDAIMTVLSSAHAPERLHPARVQANTGRGSMASNGSPELD